MGFGVWRIVAADILHVADTEVLLDSLSHEEMSSSWEGVFLNVTLNMEMESHEAVLLLIMLFFQSRGGSEGVKMII